MNTKFIKQAFAEGYRAGMEKEASPALAALLTATALHTVPGILASYGSDNVRQDPNKYWNKGKKYTGGGLLAQGVGAALLHSGNPYLKALGALAGLGGGISTVYGTNAAIAGAMGKRRNAMK